MFSTEDEGLAKFMQEFEAQRNERRAKHFAKLRGEIIPALRGAGVVTVVMEYDGYGDSTSDYSLTFLDAAGQKVKGALLSTVGENELIDILFCAVPDGYENNDGGYGQVILDVAGGTVRNEHSQRYTETTYSEEEYTL
jgi:hypothetical protein